MSTSVNELTELTTNLLRQISEVKSAQLKNLSKTDRRQLRKATDSTVDLLSLFVKLQNRLEDKELAKKERPTQKIENQTLSEKLTLESLSSEEPEEVKEKRKTSIFSKN